MLKTARFVLYTELLLLMRRSQTWVYPLAFFLIVVSLFPIALSPDPLFLQKFIPGIIWIAALLASLLSIENVFSSDVEEGHLEQWLLLGDNVHIILLAKLIASWVANTLPLILLTPLLGAVFHLTLATTLALTLGLLLGTPILTFIGSVCVALTLGLRQQGMLLGLLMLPLVIPVLVFGVLIAEQAAAHFSILAPLAFMAGITVLAITFLPVAISALLKVSVE